ncbi:putative disease resistance RPP13-like protein 1 [Chenopodium quinoa]|uniref:Uncharacterized protein n=1 Tax=Chenopodium quinoa TaxID=63459 RepID=A0A803LZV9_CHEQI|nr:putative disease resistance RPP13-like protein 1 [Chenopodium quinoa]
MAGNIKLLEMKKHSSTNSLASHIWKDRNHLGLLHGCQPTSRRRKEKLLKEVAKPSSSISISDLMRTPETLASEKYASKKDVYQTVVEAVNRLGGIKNATPEAMVDELMDYENLNLLDVYKHMQMLERPTNSEGNDIWTRTKNTSVKKPERKMSSSVMTKKESSETTRNKATVSKKFRAKVKEMGFTSNEIKSLLEGEERMWQFCTLFPERCEFEKDTLIQLWIAGGFLKGKQKDHLGDFYFSTLLSYDYIASTSTRSPIEKERYVVNIDKMMNDNANTMSHDKELFHKLKSLYYHKASKHVQYVSLVGEEIDEESLRRLTDFKELKALMLLSEDASSISKIPSNVFSALKHLEVLDLSKSNLVELPNSVGDLVKLKYLDLSQTLIELLPETIDCLSKLQTLKLKDCTHLYRLPEGMRKLTSLKHLELDVLGQLDLMPRGMGALTELETLSAFLVHNKDDDRSIKELKNMNSLKESFCIARLENVSDTFDVVKSSLSKKKYVKELELRWSDLHQHRTKSLDQDEILQGLRPHSNLEKLQISCYGGTSFPSWIGDPSFMVLTSVTLYKCDDSEILPSLGKLPSLKFLSLVEMNSVKEIGTKFRGFDTSIAFPKLERLAIVGFSKLESWEKAENGDYPRLCKLTIERCPKLVGVPSSPLKLATLKHLEIINCENLSSSFLEKKLSKSLETLIIEDCPKITEWFRRRKGAKLHKVEHVQNIWIDHELISRV